MMLVRPSLWLCIRICPPFVKKYCVVKGSWLGSQSPRLLHSILPLQGKAAMPDNGILCVESVPNTAQSDKSVDIIQPWLAMQQPGHPKCKRDPSDAACKTHFRMVMYRQGTLVRK